MNDASDVEFQPVAVQNTEQSTGLCHHCIDSMWHHLLSSCMLSLFVNAERSHLANTPSPILFTYIFLVLFQLHDLPERAAGILIQFLTLLLAAFGHVYQTPTTIATLRQWTGFAAITDHVIRCKVCEKGHSIYEYMSPEVHCPYKDLPSAAACGTPLVIQSGNRMYPKKQFAYNSLEKTLRTFFSRPTFESKIEEWRNRTREPNTLFDVYGGFQWTSFSAADGTPFVNRSPSLLLTLNVDWFNPFCDLEQYSCGAIYLTINNLPRADRYKMENVILVGVMPDPKEPQCADLNHYLRPLVHELLKLYHGVNMPTYNHPEGINVRAALLMNACDIPAARKTSGFTSHASKCACHKCNRQFDVFPGSRAIDYSEFDLSQWVLRTKESNREYAEQWRDATTYAERREIEYKTGTRWSELHRLEYFDPVWHTIIDPMHNIFLGTAKRMIAI